MRHPRLRTALSSCLLVWLMAPTIGCSRGSKSAAVADGGATAVAAASAAASAKPIAVSSPSVATGNLRFSAPIAATTLRGGATFVGGLDAARGVVVLARLRAGDGDPTWTRDVLTGVKWAPGVSLHVQAAGDRVVVFWRGPRDGTPVKQAVVVDADGKLHGGPVDIGALACATDSGIAWIDAAPKGDPHVRVAAGDAPTVDVTVLAADREPELLCGPRRIFVSARGDDDVALTVASAEGETIARKLMLARDSDFPREEEREHATYSVGDDFGVVRLGETGGLWQREVRQGALTPWKRLAAKLSPDDDLVALDADARAVVLVHTREANGGCAGSTQTASSVHALVIDRATAKVTPLDLAPGECGRDVGPFAIGRVEGALIPAWAERVTRGEKATTDGTTRGAAPIAGFAFRRVDAAGLGPLERRVQLADAVVDAGCDGHVCRVAALAREQGSDGMAPEAVRIFSYP